MKRQSNITIKIGDIRFEMIPVDGDNLWFGETTVTKALWDTVMQDTKFPSDSILPKVNISSADANRFVKRLNEMNVVGDLSLAFRLPTEVEWELAACGGRHSRGFVYSGSNNIDEVAWFWDNSVPQPVAGSHFYIGEPEVQAVKGKLPNELGIYDMSGNVWEWCEANGGKVVCRGGCYESEADECTVKAVFIPDVKKDCRIGFRLALAPIDKTNK